MQSMKWSEQPIPQRIFLVLAGLLGLALPLSTALTTILLPLLVLAGLWLGRSSLPVVLRQPPVWLALLVFLSLTVGLAHGNAADGLAWLDKYRKLLYLPFLTLFFLQDRRLAAWLIAGFLLGNVLILAASSWQWMTVDHDWLGLPAGPSRCFPGLAAGCVTKNAIAQSLLMAIAAGVLAILSLQPGSWRVVFLGLCGWMLLNLFVMAPQRIGFLGIAILLLWCCLELVRSRWRWLWLGVALSLLVALVLTPNPLSERIRLGIAEVQDCIKVVNDPAARDIACRSSMGLRTHFYVQSIDRIKASPWIGHGTGNLGIPDLAEFRIGNPHNEYLLQGIQTGLTGIFLYAGLLASGFLLARRLPRPWSALGSGIILVYAAGSLLNSFLMDITEGSTFVVLLSLLLATTLARPDKVCDRG